MMEPNAEHNGVFYKVLSSNLKHWNFQYRLGLNVDTIPFNPTGKCQPGGLYYATKEHIAKFLGFGCFIAEIYIPDDAKIYKDPNGDKFKADRIIIKSITPIRKMSWWSDIAFCELAVTQSLQSIIYVGNQTEDLCLRSACFDGMSIRYMTHQTNAVCMAAITNNPCALQFVLNQTEQICKYALELDPDTHKYIRDKNLLQSILQSKQHNKVFYKVLHKTLIHHGFQYRLGLNIDPIPFNPTGKGKPGGFYFTTKEHIAYFLRFGCFIAEIYIPDDAKVYDDPGGYASKADRIIIKSITPIQDMPWWSDIAFCNDAVRQSMHAIKFIRNATDEMYMIILKKRPEYILYIENPSEYICQATVKIDGMALAYIDPVYQTEIVCLLAVNNTGLAIKYVARQTKELCLIAVRNHVDAILYVDDDLLSDEIYAAAY